MKKIIAVLAVIAMVGMFATIIIQDIDMRTDPTYASAKNFIDTDKTDEHQYIETIYDCHEFSKDVQYNASLSNIKCAYVMLLFEDVTVGENHAIVAFDTTDRGIIFFEPQTDEEVSCTIGNDYIISSRSFKIIDIQYFWEIL